MGEFGTLLRICVCPHWTWIHDTSKTEPQSSRTEWCRALSNERRFQRLSGMHLPSPGGRLPSPGRAPAPSGEDHPCRQCPTGLHERSRVDDAQINGGRKQVPAGQSASSHATRSQAASAGQASRKRDSWFQEGKMRETRLSKKATKKGKKERASKKQAASTIAGA